MTLRRSLALVLLSACSSSPSAPPTAAECRSACERLIAECATTHDCDALCRDLVLDAEDGSIACLEARGPAFVACAERPECETDCATEADDLAACNRLVCSFRPELPACSP